MRTDNVPVTGPRYWTALSAASVFGANMGDFVSHNLRLGHANGLAPLALIFALTWLAERRAPFRTEAFYWLAIVVLRTAATNLGDLMTHDFAIAYPATLAVLTAILFAIPALGSRRAAPPRPTTGVPPTDGFYWATMLTAGTLGTAAGDYVAGAIGLGLGHGLGTIALSAVLAVCLAGRRFAGYAAWTYWATVVAIRSAGTTGGDFLAGRHDLALGLPISTAISGFVLIAILLAWPAARPASGPAVTPAAP